MLYIGVFCSIPCDVDDVGKGDDFDDETVDVTMTVNVIVAVGSIVDVKVTVLQSVVLKIIDDEHCAVTKSLSTTVDDALELALLVEK